MKNVGGNIIKRIEVYEGIFHCLVQDKEGLIHHRRFESLKEAIEFMDGFQCEPVKVEYL